MMRYNTVGEVERAVTPAETAVEGVFRFFLDVFASFFLIQRGGSSCGRGTTGVRCLFTFL